MKIKIFDESHEKDLEEDINEFIKEKSPDIIDIKYCVSTSAYAEEQIYCFSALIMYTESKESLITNINQRIFSNLSLIKFYFFLLY